MAKLLLIQAHPTKIKISALAKPKEVKRNLNRQFAPTAGLDVQDRLIADFHIVRNT